MIMISPQELNDHWPAGFGSVTASKDREQMEQHNGHPFQSHDVMGGVHQGSTRSMMAFPCFPFSGFIFKLRKF